MSTLDAAKANVEKTAADLARARATVGVAKAAYNAALMALRTAKAQPVAAVPVPIPPVKAKPKK